LKTVRLNIWIFCFLSCISANAQDSLVLQEIQTYFLDGKLNSIDSYKFNENGDIKRFTQFESDDNQLYVENYYYDSIHRLIKKITTINDKLLDSSIFRYESNLKREFRWRMDSQFNNHGENWIIYYDKNNNPVKELWYDLTFFSNGEALENIISETRHFYDNYNRIIVDTIYNSGVLSNPQLFLDSKLVIREKLFPVEVIGYHYDGLNIESIEKTDEYGDKSIDQYIRDDNGLLIQFDQLTISQNDTNKITTTYQKIKNRNRKILIEETKTVGAYSKSKTTFDRSGKKVKHESLDNQNNTICMTEFIYNSDGYLKEEIFQFFSKNRPINDSSNIYSGFKKIYIYKNTANTK
jgi:hypothetical protein